MTRGKEDISEYESNEMKCNVHEHVSVLHYMPKTGAIHSNDITEPIPTRIHSSRSVVEPAQ